MSKEKKDFEETRENEFKDIPEEVCSPFFPEGCIHVEGVTNEDGVNPANQKDEE